MLTSTEKKILSFGKSTYTLVMGKRWYIEYYVTRAGGVLERKRLTGMNRIKDLKLREAKAMEIIAGLHSEKKSPSVLLAILEECKDDFRLKTYQTFKSRVNIFLAWLGKKSDSTVVTNDAAAFLRHLATKQKKPATIHSYRASLGALYMRIDRKNNPFSETKAPPKGSTSLMFFSDAQIKKIKNHTRLHNQQLLLAIELLYYCFIRPEEMRSLELQDFNLEYGFIEIRAAISKNKKSQKVVIPTPLLNELRENAIFEKYPGRYLVFGRTAAPGLIAIKKNYLNEQHSIILKKLSIIGRYSFYSWKHTGVVKAVLAGVGLKDLQMQLRHHSLDMVNEYLKNFGILDSDDLKNKFPAL